MRPCIRYGKPDECGPAAQRLPHVQALDGLASDVGYDFEVFVEMQDGESGEFRSRSDDEVRY
jgi:hypothetical protein